MTVVTVVTPWYQHPELTDGYLAALEAGPWPHEVLVVDNGDAPDLPGCEVIEAGDNLGFVGGSNLGLDEASGDAVLFLNNDIRLGRAGWLDEIVALLEPGVLVGQLRWHGQAMVDGIPMPYLDGWCLAGMRVDLQDLGGFDDALAEPAYFSDNLLCLEARAAGMTLRDVRVGLEHLENTTAGPAHDPRVAEASRLNRERYVARARELLVAA